MSTQQPTHESVVAAAAAEQRQAPATEVEAADLADKYDRMMRLADLFDDSGEEMRQRAKLGADVINDPAFAESAELSKATHAQAEDDIRAATTGKQGLLTRSIELDADALVLRATVLTYRWIDELQDAAYQTLGTIAGRAIGYLAPEVALGGAIVSAGLIETDALDRDGVAAYLSELADSNPELMEHVTSGGGGLIDGLQMRSVLTAGVLSGDQGRLAGQGGLRATGIDSLSAAFGAAVRDVAGGLVQSAPGRGPGHGGRRRGAAHAGRADVRAGGLREQRHRAAGHRRPLHRLPRRSRRRQRPAAPAGRRRPGRVRRARRPHHHPGRRGRPRRPRDAGRARRRAGWPPRRWRPR